MEVLIGVAIVTWVLKAAFEDAVYALRGRPSPRLEAALKAGRPYGARDYFSRLWSDASEAMANREQWAKRDGARGYLGRRWDEAWKRAWERHSAKARAADEPRPAGAADTDMPPSEEPAPERLADPLPEPGANTAPDQPTSKPGTDLVIDGEWTDTTPKEEPTMTAPTMGEVVSLNDAIRWTEQIGQGAASAIQAVEGAISDLRGQNVGEEAIAKLGRMQETYAVLVAQAGEAHAEFVGHTSVKEAYTAQANAGSKQHLLAD